MTTRTTKRTVTFRRPFVLPGFDRELPAGDYNVETDEKLLEGISFPAYRRTMTVIILPANAGVPGLTQTLTIDPNELDAALERDQARAKSALAISDTDQRTLPGAWESRLNAADRQAVERAENEGMIVRPR